MSDKHRAAREGIMQLGAEVGGAFTFLWQQGADL